MVLAQVDMVFHFIVSVWFTDTCSPYKKSYFLYTVKDLALYLQHADKFMNHMGLYHLLDEIF